MTMAENIRTEIERKVEALKNQNDDFVEKKLIEHRVVVEGANEKLKEELEDKQAQLESLALKEFEVEKNSLAEEYPTFESEIEDCSSGFELDRLRTVLERVGYTGRSKVPCGKISGRNPEPQKSGNLRSREFPSHEALIDYLVSAKHMAEHEKTKHNSNLEIIDEGEEASRMLDELWEKAYEGDKIRLPPNKRLVFEEDPSWRGDAYIKDIRKKGMFRG